MKRKPIITTKAKVLKNTMEQNLHQHKKLAAERKIYMVKKIALCTMVFITLIQTALPVYANTKSYSVYIKTYKRNSIIIEFPQIKDMENSQKQKEINYILERAVFRYLTDLFSFWELDYSDYQDGKRINILKTINDTSFNNSLFFEFICNVGYANNNIISVFFETCSFSRGAAHPNSWGFSYTVDIPNEKVIDLKSFIMFDSEILNYKSANANYKAALTTNSDNGSIADYCFLDEHMSGRKLSDAEMINKLYDFGWYISKNRDIVLYSGIQNTYQSHHTSLDKFRQNLNEEYRSKLFP